MDVLDISSDEDLGLEVAPSGGSGGGGDINDVEEANFDWLKEVFDNLGSPPVLSNDDDDDDDDVILIREVPAPPGKRRRNLRDDCDDDCVVLDGDPDKPKLMNQSLDTDREQNLDLGGGDSDDLVIVGEKGQVACRDYPHSRHLCVKFPFGSTLHVDYCNMCHCYVCETPAPCDEWGTGISPGDHCHAFDKAECWINERKRIKVANSSAPNSVSVPTAGPLVNKAQELSTQVQGSTYLSVPNSTCPVPDPVANKVKELSMLLQGPTMTSVRNSTCHGQVANYVNRAQHLSTQVQGRVFPSAPNSSHQLLERVPHHLRAQLSSTHFRGITHSSAPNSVPATQIRRPHEMPNIISRGRPIGSPPVSGISHRYHSHLVSRHLTRSQSDNHREVGGIFRPSPSVPLIRKHQPAGIPLVDKTGPVSYKNTFGALAGNSAPSMGQNRGPVPSTGQNLGALSPPWEVQQLVQQVDTVPHAIADAGPLLTSNQSGNHNLFPTSPMESTTVRFPAMQNNSFLDGGAKPVYSPECSYNDMLDNLLFGSSMNNQNGRSHTTSACPSSVPDPVDDSWDYLVDERAWKE